VRETTPIRGTATIVAMDHLKVAYWGMPRAGRICCLLAPPLFALAVGPSFFTDDGPDVWVIVGVVAVFVMWPAILVGHWRLSDAQKQVSYEIDGEQIAMRDAAGTSVAVPWTVAKRAVETGSGFVVKLRPAGSRWLPKRAFSPEGVTALRQLIKEKLGGAAKLAAP